MEDKVNGQPVWDRIDPAGPSYCAMFFKGIWYIIKADDNLRQELIDTQGESITQLNLGAISAKVSSA